MENKKFTVAELAEFNGKKGKPSYAAVDGIVYDVSDIFDNGDHYSHMAGQDSTDEYYLQHAKEEIEKHPIVGKPV